MLTEKFCPKCQITKPITDFGVMKCRKNRPQSWCKACHAANKQARKKNQERYKLDKQRILDWRRANPDKTKNSVLKRDYGITLDQYNAMFQAQSGVCAICGKPETAIGQNGKPRALAVDHDHKSGETRGLLCGNCNRAVGYLQDNPELCEKAAKYLRASALTSQLEVESAEYTCCNDNECNLDLDSKSPHMENTTECMPLG